MELRATAVARSLVVGVDRHGVLEGGGRASPIARVALAGLAVGGFLVIQQVLLPSHTLHVLWITMVAAVILTAAFTGFLASIAASFLGAIVIDVVVLEPIGTGVLSSSEDAVALLLFLGVALFGASAASRSQTPETRTPRQPLTRGASDLIEPLTARELDVLELLGRGLSNDEIARALVLSQNTVKTHLEHVYGKLGVSSRGRAVAEASRRGILEVGHQITRSGEESRPSG